MGTTQQTFVHLARTLQHEAARLGLTVPAFRSPCQVKGTHRSIRRRPNGTVILVDYRGRHEHAVAEDMIAGILAANEIDQADGDLFRSALWQATGQAVG